MWSAAFHPKKYKEEISIVSSLLQKRKAREITSLQHKHPQQLFIKKSLGCFFKYEPSYNVCNFFYLEKYVSLLRRITVVN